MRKTNFSKSSLSACNARPVHTDGPGTDERHCSKYWPDRNLDTGPVEHLALAADEHRRSFFDESPRGLLVILRSTSLDLMGRLKIEKRGER
jgi:hypothetical protein